jgi:hypothetical protein
MVTIAAFLALRNLRLIGLPRGVWRQTRPNTRQMAPKLRGLKANVENARSRAYRLAG